MKSYQCVEIIFQLNCHFPSAFFVHLKVINPEEEKKRLEMITVHRE